MIRRLAGVLAMRAERARASGWMGPLLLAALHAHPVLGQEPSASGETSALQEPSPPRGPSVIPALSTCGGRGALLDVVLVGGTAQPAIVASICDWFRDGRWRVRLSSASAPPLFEAARSLRVIATLESDERARLVLDTPQGRRWVRDVALAHGLDAAGVEVLAQALHSTVQATSTPPPPSRRAAPASTAAAPSRDTPAPMAMPGPGGTPPVQVSSNGTSSPAPSATALSSSVESTSPAATAHRHPASTHLPALTGLGYQAYFRGPEPLAHGPTLRIALDWLWREPLRLGSFFSGALSSASRKRVDGLEVDSSMATLAAGLHVASSSSPLSARAGLGGGVDLIALDVRVLDSDRLRLLPNQRARARPFVLAAAGGAWRKGPIEIALNGLLRYQLLATRYQILDDSTLVNLFRPWRLQPGLALEAAYLW